MVIIGTMNTSDRSIALLDAAMRRRFAFIELHPDEAPTSGVLAAWLAKRGLSNEPAELLTALNALIHDRAYRIGPSYLMPSDGDLSDARLRDIWRYEILPLLEETHYGEGLEIEGTYGLAVLRSRLKRAVINDPSKEPVAASRKTPSRCRMVSATDFRLLEVTEGDRAATLRDVDFETAAALERLKIGSITPVAPGEWRISGIRKVGVVRVRGIEVRIQPKTRIDRLFFLLSRTVLGRVVRR